FAIKRVADPQISPDGKWVAYVVTSTDFDANKRNNQIWVASTASGDTRQVTSGGGSNDRPRWSPDGKLLSFVSTRDGSSQIWILDMANGGEARKVTSISTGASGQVWSPDGRSLLFASDVYPECADDACNKARADAVEASKVKAKIATHLLYRHWNAWKEGLRTHVFVVPVAGGLAKDLTPGDFDAPPFASGNQDPYVFSADGREVCFSRNTDAVEATSTNSDLWLVPVTGGEAKRITADCKGWDGSPLYSPDGRLIAYLSQERAGFEADRFRLMVFDRQTAQVRELTQGFDRSVLSFVWAPDGRRLICTIDDEAYAPVVAIDVASGKMQRLIDKVTAGELSITADGKTIAMSNQSEVLPSEVFTASSDGTGVRQLTATNKALLAERTLTRFDDLVSTQPDGTKVHSLICKPAGFDPAKKYPLLVLIHGGPQGAWEHNFGYRWNPEVFASNGPYVVLMTNFRGSTGYGQKFTDAVSGDWGGKPYEDVMKAVDDAAALPYVDGTRIGAAGGSYGGYMVNWIMGHTDRFKVLVSHAGIYNTKSMSGVTEELWFNNWEFGGTQYTKPELYEKFSPSNFATNFKTPTLVVVGELDYRVPVGEGLQLFTALQTMNVPSKLLYYPDEGHWVLKPQNSALWYHTFLDWVGSYLKP
ncbi:MAG TPA: S9 family peptidase, partial [Blastocatellia bacterium]|nr:S9 family peptidase [Blastocatellia bacterium]